jgi:hypothetical protein
LDEILARKSLEINSILDEYGVPRIGTTPGGVIKGEEAR